VSNEDKTDNRVADRIVELRAEQIQILDYLLLQSTMKANLMTEKVAVQIVLLDLNRN
jgi:hypothetical protein